ncbi:MAG: hypothetical protein F6J89_15980 [Symploca sp. SIO1C4]|uniref:Uncharacterized protein n=1 Tax=Symploca sp. SIO1C4 TaxID=2607765 RepID=A0A6B3N5R2_9CYAN|nr:hypothetical protein [Symploca sp. SIO1C4]
MPTVRYSDQHKELISLLRKGLAKRTGQNDVSAAAVVNQILVDYGAAIASEWLGSTLPVQPMLHDESALKHSVSPMHHRPPERPYTNKPHASSSDNTVASQKQQESISEQEQALLDAMASFQ